MISKRAEEIQPFLAMEVLERATALEREGARIIHLEVGEPDFPTPACIQEAAARALRDGRTKYTHSLGLPALREAIAEHYLHRYGVTVSPDQVLVTTGTSPALWLLFSALLESGDEVILRSSGAREFWLSRSPGSFSPMAVSDIGEGFGVGRQDLEGSYTRGRRDDS